MNNPTSPSKCQMKWKTVIAGLLCFVVSTGVYAEQYSKACAEDAAKLCAGVQQGEGRVARCLREHANNLSPACKEDIGILKEKIRDFAQACRDDKERFCKDTKPGEGRILQCLKRHEAELSTACKEQMTHPKRRS